MRGAGGLIAANFNLMPVTGIVRGEFVDGGGKLAGGRKTVGKGCFRKGMGILGEEGEGKRNF